MLMPNEVGLAVMQERMREASHEALVRQAQLARAAEHQPAMIAAPTEQGERRHLRLPAFITRASRPQPV